MEAMEARIANSKNMFKKLNEQQEINAAKQEAKVMTPEEVARLPLLEVFEDLNDIASLDEWKRLFIQAQGTKK